MFKPRNLSARLTLAFVVALIAAACGGSSSDGDAAAAGGDVVTAEQTTTTEAVVEDDHTEEMTEPMEGDDHEESEHMDEGEGHEPEGHNEGDGHGASDGGVVDPADVPADATVVFVTMDEWGFDPGAFTAKAGETVLFRITNAGMFVHEFRLSNTHRIEEHITSGHDDHAAAPEGGHHSEDGDIVIEVQPRSLGELVVTFPTDITLFTDVVCLIPGHYENGMFAELGYDA